MRIQNKIAFLCVFSGGSLCIGSDNADIQKNDEAFCGIFTPGITFSDDSKPDDIKRFLQLLKKCLGNPVAKKTIELLATAIKNQAYPYRKKLKVVVADIPEFKIGMLSNPDEIQFCSSGIDTQVISETEPSQTINESTQPELLLFHEFLHYARHVIKSVVNKKKYIEEDKNEQEMTLADVPDFPELKAWTMYLDECLYRFHAINRHRKLFEDAKLFQAGCIVQRRPDESRNEKKSLTLEKMDKLEKITIVKIEEDLFRKGQEFYEGLQYRIDQSSNAKSNINDRLPELSNEIITAYRKLFFDYWTVSDNDLLSNPWIVEKNPRICYSEMRNKRFLLNTRAEIPEKFTVKRIDRDEIRNIIGDGVKSAWDIDKISENGFRLAGHLHLRYGHSGVCCKLTPGIVDWVMARARECCGFCGVIND